MSRAQVSSMLPYHFGSFSLVPKTGSQKHPVDKCRSTCLERCGIASLTSKRLVKQALNDCWYLVKLDKEQEGRIEKERERKEQKKRREGGSVGPVGPTCFEEVQAAKLSLRDAERVSLAFSSLSYLSSLQSFFPFHSHTSLRPHPASLVAQCPPLIHKYEKGRVYPLLGTLRTGTGVILSDIISIPQYRRSASPVYPEESH